MTADLEQRAYDDAHRYLLNVTGDSGAKAAAEWVLDSLRETRALHGIAELKRLADSAAARYAWSLAFAVWTRNRLNPDDVDAAVAAAARVLAEEQR